MMNPISLDEGGSVFIPAGTPHAYIQGTEVRDNIRFGLEFDKSAFGKYNVDNAVNAGFRYSF